MANLKETFLDELKDLYDAEQQLVKGLPKMAKAAENEELKAAFEEHLAETEAQVERLERVFEAIDEKPARKTCKAMKGLLEEAKELIEEDAGDAALIAGAQKVEHYEIASYGSLASWARLMQNDEAAELLEETLDEEKSTDERLTEIAESAVNVEENEEEEEESEEPKSSARKASKK